MSEEYRGFKSRRHFINSKLHGLSVKICGNRTVLDESIYRIISARSPQDRAINTSQCWLSTTMLTDPEATNLYNEMLKTLAKVQKNINKAKAIAGDKSEMSVAQRKAIIKITRYNFNWSPEATFSFILSVLPEKRKRLSSWEIQNSKLLKLYSLISSPEASKIIKRLDSIIKRNQIKGAKQMNTQKGPSALVIAELESDGVKARLNIYVQSTSDIPFNMGNSSFLLNYPKESLMNPELEFQADKYSTGDYAPIEVKPLFLNRVIGIQLRCTGRGAEVSHNQPELLCSILFEQTSEVKLTWRSEDTAVVSSSFATIPTTFIIKGNEGGN